MTLEGAKAQDEGTEATSVVEEPKPTQEKVEPTVKVTETVEFRKELDIALGKGLASTNQKLSTSQAEIQTARAETDVQKASVSQLEGDVSGLTAEIDRLASDKFADDADALRGYKQTRTLELREKKAALREKEIDLRDAQQNERAFTLTKVEIGTELQKTYKVPNKALQACTTEEQMRTIAETFPKVDEESEKEPTKTESKFDSTIPSGGGGMPDKAIDKMRAGWAELHKNK